MTSNCGITAKETNKPVKSCPSAILKAVPEGYETLKFIQLSEGENYEKKAIIGKICVLHPIIKRVNGYHRKLLLTDGLEIPTNDEQKKLPVFLFDTFAEESEIAVVEGFILISNFMVEKSAHRKENEFSFQVSVKKAISQIWFAKLVSPNSKKKKKRKIENGVGPDPLTLSNNYEYVPLRDLRETVDKETFHIYGIVEKCELQNMKDKSKLELILTDSTESGFPCIVFCAKDDVFPNIYPGDIIRIHRMTVHFDNVSKFRNKLKGKCFSSKFILVFSKNNDSYKPRTTAKSFTFTPEDIERAKNLFEWYDKKNQPKLISEIQRTDYVKIVCQVIGVYISMKHDVVTLKIWDGTKTNQVEGTHLGLLGEKLDMRLYNIAKHYYINLFVYGQHCTTAGELKPGQFIEVSDANLYCPKDNPDDCKLCLHSANGNKRGIKVLNLDDSRVIELKDRLEKIIADAQELGNQTDDILNEDNSIFLNCDISTLPSSQRTNKNEEAISQSSQKSCNSELENADIEVLNNPMPSREQITHEREVISVTDAGVKPGQSTLEFGEEMRNEYLEMDQTQDGESSRPFDQVVNATPLDRRMLLHNPSSQANTKSVPPFIHDSPEEWRNTISGYSVTEEHSNIKPSTLSEIIQHDVPYKFRSLCAVISYMPNINSALNLIHLYCPNCLFMAEHTDPSLEPFIEQDGVLYFHCPDCLDEDNRPTLKYTYLIAFELHDWTVPKSLEVVLWGDNATKFFKGITPEQVLTETEIAESILHMLWNICPNNRPSNSSKTLNNQDSRYPILDCCIMSYSTSNRTVYQIFDTKLI